MVSRPSKLNEIGIVNRVGAGSGFKGVTVAVESLIVVPFGSWIGDCGLVVEVEVVGVGRIIVEFGDGLIEEARLVIARWCVLACA